MNEERGNRDRVRKDELYVCMFGEDIAADRGVCRAKSWSLIRGKAKNSI
jgi:hypothetical protein